jgi:hypothetical protein
MDTINIFRRTRSYNKTKILPFLFEEDDESKESADEFPDDPVMKRLQIKNCVKKNFYELEFNIRIPESDPGPPLDPL